MGRTPGVPDWGPKLGGYGAGLLIDGTRSLLRGCAGGPPNPPRRRRFFIRVGTAPVRQAGRDLARRDQSPLMLISTSATTGHDVFARASRRLGGLGARSRCAAPSDRRRVFPASSQNQIVLIAHAISHGLSVAWLFMPSVIPESFQIPGRPIPPARPIGLAVLITARRTLHRCQHS